MHRILLVFVLQFAFSQTESILPAQLNAIKTLSTENGFTDEQLNNYLLKHYNNSLNDLSKSQAIQIIQLFQGINPPKPLINPPTLAETLEIGMSKQFYLIDGNRLMGKIEEINDNICHIKTAEGLLKIPMSDILEETIDLTKIDDARYKGPLISEDEESLIIRSKYGDVTIYKKEIKKMDRYHGGKLIPWVENKKKFHQGEDELIGVFFDDNAFVLDPNTFFLSGMSIGYGFTDKFMITTQFGSNFNGDLNLHPKMRFWHEKTSKKERAMAWGLGLHRAYPLRKIISKYGHAWYGNNNKANTLNTLDWNANDIDKFISNEDPEIFIEAYLVYSTKRKNPTGRGKVGWSVGLLTNNMFALTDEKYTCTTDCPKDLDDNEINTINFNKDDAQFSVPFRVFATFEYDLQKQLKFVGSMWLDNSSRSVVLDDVIDDYFDDQGDSFSFDGLDGKYNIFDFDFGFLYAINDNFRLGIHFQQPYIDIHWEFFEF